MTKWRYSPCKRPDTRPQSSREKQCELSTCGNLLDELLPFRYHRKYNAYMKPDDTCLIFKHFPSEITEEECVGFLKSLGATSAQYLGNSGPLKYCAYAEFTSEQHAWNIIKNLHQKRILDRRLSVEFAHLASVKHQKTNPNQSFEKEYSPVTTNAFSAMWDPSFNVPSQLYYDYPAVSNNVLTNIVRSLAYCPAFYNQVLHIMNKLHLPPPFDDPEHFPGDYLVISATDYARMQTIIDNLQHNSKKDQNDADLIAEEMDLSSGSESELASDNDTKTTAQRQNISVRRRLKIRRKLYSVSLTHNPVTSKRQNVAVSDLFEAPPITKKLHLPDVLNVNSKPNHHITCSDIEVVLDLFKQNLSDFTRNRKTNSSSLSDFQLRKERLSDDEDEHEATECRIPLIEQSCVSSQNIQTVSTDNGSSNLLSVLSVDELLSNRLKVDEYKNYTVFAKYDTGTPTSRLYVKNLSQTVTENDLFEIFGVFSNGPVNDNSWKPRILMDSTDNFSVRLLTEGRMKGQAFIGLACESTANKHWKLQTVICFMVVLWLFSSLEEPRQKSMRKV
ncbi:unnamed protein product [Heterobilharzia americana]|nr:unnamed protein product [Heterobilharzia americana]